MSGGSASSAHREAAGRTRPRRSKRALRWWAYVGSALSFTVPWAVLTAAPQPHANGERSPQVIEIHKITRRIIVQDRPDAPSGPAGGAPQVRYVYVGGGSNGGGGGGAVHTRCSTC